MTITKRTAMTIATVLTLLAGCAWENSWFGQRSALTLSVSSSERR